MSFYLRLTLYVNMCKIFNYYWYTNADVSITIIILSSLISNILFFIFFENSTLRCWQCQISNKLGRAMNPKKRQMKLWKCIHNIYFYHHFVRFFHLHLNKIFQISFHLMSFPFTFFFENLITYCELYIILKKRVI